MPKATRSEIAAARAVVLQRDQNTCQRCGVNVLYQLASVQHRIPRGAGGSAKVWQVSNLALVCGWATTPGSCHNWMEHENRKQAEFDGWLLPKLNADIDTEQEPLLTIHGWITLDDRGGSHPYLPQEVPA